MSAPFNPKTICGISYPFGQLFLTLGHVPTRYSAVRHSSAFSLFTPPSLIDIINKREANSENLLPFDLHVLGTPPAFILSQDQTLR